VLSCSDRACNLPRRSCNISQPASQCAFYNLYAEGSSSGGVIFKDTLLLPQPGGRAPEVLPEFTFGCAKFQTVRRAEEGAGGGAGTGLLGQGAALADARGAQESASTAVRVLLSPAPQLLGARACA
jgi:hypothetical protein